MTAPVAVLMGSDSDLPVVQGCLDKLRELEVEVDYFVLSAHRTPDLTHRFAKSAHEKGYRILIAAAGGAAHLAGVLAAVSPLPVIGIPILGEQLAGLDSLLSTVQMPAGIPVATVGVGKSGAVNAAILAVRILALGDPALAERFEAFRRGLQEKVIAKNEKLGTSLDVQSL